jgi:plastocyanin
MLTATASPTATATPATAPTLAIVDFAFQPAAVTVYRGETVRWTNNAALRSHTTTGTSGMWDSGSLSPGQSYGVVFGTAGMFDYYCAIHPSMSGRITVLDTPVTATATATPSQSATASATVSTSATATATPSQTPTRSPTATQTATPTASQTSTPTPTSAAILLGSGVVQPLLDSNPAGMAEAFQYTAGASGTATKLVVYLDQSNTATQVVVGLYADGANGPGALLAQGTITSPVKGSWNAAAIAPVAVSAGTTYWIAVLGPAGGALVQVRDVPVGGRTQISAQTNLTTLPPAWSPGENYLNAPMSAYAAP